MQNQSRSSGRNLQLTIFGALLVACASIQPRLQPADGSAPTPPTVNELSRLEPVWRVGTQDPSAWGGVRQLAWKPDGAQIVLVSNQQLVVLDTQTLSVAKQIPIAVSTAQWAPQGGNRLLVAGLGGDIGGDALGGLSDSGALGVAVINAATGEQTANFEGTGGDNTRPVVAWSPDGAYVAGGAQRLAAEGKIVIWDASSGATLRSFDLYDRGDTLIQEVAWFADGRELLTLSSTRLTRYTATGTKLGQVDLLCPFPAAVALSRNAEQIAMACWGEYGATGNLTIQNARTGDLVTTVQNLVLRSLTWSADSTRLVVGDGAVAQVIEIATGRITTTVAQRMTGISIATWNPTGTEFVTGGQNGGLATHDASTGRTLQTLGVLSRSNNVYSVAWTTNPPAVIDAGRNGRVFGRSPANGNGNLDVEADPSGVYGLAVRADGQRFATSGQGGSVRLWNRDGSAIASLEGHTYTARGLAWSPDGSRLASAGWDDTVRLWNPDTLEVIGVMKDHTNFVNAVAFNPNGSQLASVSSDGTLKRWNPVNGTLLSSLTAPGALFTVAWSVDGTRLAAAGADKDIYIWQSASGVLERTLTGHLGAVRTVVFTPDGSGLVSGSDDGTIKLWNLARGEDVATVGADSLAVFSLTLKDDVVIAGGANGAITAWRLK